MQDTFLGGVEPGGLTDRFEVKILVCYLWSGQASAFRSNDQRYSAESGIGELFELSAALAELLQNDTSIRFRWRINQSSIVCPQKGSRCFRPLATAFRYLSGRRHWTAPTIVASETQGRAKQGDHRPGGGRIYHYPADAGFGSVCDFKAV